MQKTKLKLIVKDGLNSWCWMYIQGYKLQYNLIPGDDTTGEPTTLEINGITIEFETDDVEIMEEK